MSSALSHLLPHPAPIPGERGVPPPHDQIDYLRFIAERNEKIGQPRPINPIHEGFLQREAWK